MRNPLNLPRDMYDWVVPAPQERWQRSGMTEEVVVKQDAGGHNVIVPLFNVGIDSVELLGSREFGSRQKPAGKVHVDLYHLKDGMSRLAQTWIPYDIQAQYTGTSGMAFTTMVPGYDQDRSEMMATVGIPTIQISAEQGDRHWPELADIARLGKTVLNSPSISIAKSSQAETEVIADLVERHRLPRLIEAHGDSRGSMTSIGRAVYGGLKSGDSNTTPMYDLIPLWIDPKAVVLHDRLPAERLHKVASWLVREAIIGPRVIADLAIQRKLLSLRGTASLNPNFLLASAIGTAPALLSGEVGELTAALPDDVRGFANGYSHDELFDKTNWEEALQPFPNLYLNQVDKAVHAHLLSMRGLLRQLGRFERLAQQSREHGANLAAYDVYHISSRTSEQFALQKGTSLQNAA